jgi:hypothetical protein
MEEAVNGSSDSNPDPVERDGLAPSPQIVDGPWWIKQGNPLKTAGYVWSFKVEMNGAIVGTIEHWFVVVSPNGNNNYQAFSTTGDWTLTRLTPNGQDYDRGTATDPAPPPAVGAGPSVTYQRWTTWSSKVGGTFNR